MKLFPIAWLCWLDDWQGSLLSMECPAPSRGILLQAFRKLRLADIWHLYWEPHTSCMLTYMHTVHSWWATITLISKLAHRVDGVLGLFSSSELGLTPSPAGECMCSPFLWLEGGGEGRTRLRKRGGGFPIPTRGQTLWYSRYICTLWERTFTDRMLKMWNPERLDHWIDFKYIDKSGHL